MLNAQKNVIGKRGSVNKNVKIEYTQKFVIFFFFYFEKNNNRDGLIYSWTEYLYIDI